MVESEGALKTFFMKVKEKSEKAGLKLNISKTKIMASSPITLGFLHSSVGKESACNAGDPSLIPGSGRSAGEGIGYPLWCSWASFVAGKESACNAEDLGLILGLGRSLREGNGNPSSIPA